MEYRPTADGDEEATIHRIPELRRFIDALADLRELYHRMEAIADRFSYQSLNSRAASSTSDLEPDVDIYENDQEFSIHAAVPGAAPHSIRVEAAAHSVTIVAETYHLRQADEEPETSGNSKRHRRSRHSDHERFRFVYALHSAVVPEAVSAVLRNGIVEIRMPKSPTAPAYVVVPLHPHEEPRGSATAHLKPAYPPDTEIVIRSAHEGNPRQKLGASYAPSPGEDHAGKAQAVGDLPTAELMAVQVPSSQADQPTANLQPRNWPANAKQSSI